MEVLALLGGGTMSSKHPWESKWKVLNRLGQGGQAVTHKVVSIANETDVGVLKTLKNNRNLQQRRRMNREVLSLGILSDAGARVPRVLDHNSEQREQLETQLYLVTEFVGGPTLQSYVEEQGPMDFDVAADFVVDLCHVIRTGHELGILHRDGCHPE